MLTQSPQHLIAGHAVVPGMALDRGPGLVMGFLNRLQRSICGIHGHTNMLQFEQDRMFLVCASCGHETPGWETGQRRRSLRLAPERGRRQASRPDLTPARRVA